MEPGPIARGPLLARICLRVPRYQGCVGVESY
jgi:hypothetical protein